MNPPNPDDAPASVPTGTQDLSELFAEFLRKQAFGAAGANKKLL
jgi:hypothetical protein